MRSPAVGYLFGLRGRLKRLPYLAACVAVFLAQCGALEAVQIGLGKPLHLDPLFLLMPARAVLQAQGPQATLAMLAVSVITLAAGWAFAALSFRRAADAGASGMIAATAIVPVIQILAIVGLSIAPSDPQPSPPAAEDGDPASTGWGSAVQGLLAGGAITAGAVTLGTLGRGVYGVGVFLIAPFFVGAVTAYLINRRGRVSVARTCGVIACALLTGAVALLAISVEGVVCLAMAAPLAYGVALAGGFIGRAAARSGRGSAAETFNSVAALPILLLIEPLLMAPVQFDVTQAVDIAAPPAQVWSALVHMGSIDERPILPFRLGVAYAQGAVIEGEGVGARRLGLFSTGIAEERVTEWRPDRALAFEVLKDPPSMHELSPYRHVQAPHVIGYFRTTATRFSLTPLTGGGTRLTLSSHHTLNLAPVPYWRPMAEWIVTQGGARVLLHVKRESETERQRP